VEYIKHVGRYVSSSRNAAYEAAFLELLGLFVYFIVRLWCVSLSGG